MFSVAQKRRIAAAVEKELLAVGHPEMPSERPRFLLHVDGKEAWSWADIQPNWKYDDGNPPAANPHNELVDVLLCGKPAFRIGEYTIAPSRADDDSKVAIYHSSGEGGDFDAALFSHAVEAFFNANF